MPMQKSKPRVVTEMKSAAQLWAEEEARVVIAKDKAAVEAQAAAETKADEEIWNAAAKERARAKAAAATEARAAEEARIAATARLEAKARAQDAEEARIATLEKARANAEEEANAKARREAKAAEEARLAEGAKKRAEEDAKAMAEIEAMAAEEARVVASAKIKAEIKARAAEEARIAAEAKSKARRETRAKAAENAKVRILARAHAAKKAGPTEAPPKAGEDASAQAEPETTQAESFKKRKPGKVSSQNCWFYTCQGERLGPVNFEELRSMATNSSLDPRLDMVWRQSMDAWKPAGQVDGLFERNNVSVESKETLAPPTGSIFPPRKSSRKPTSKNASWPGARRRSFLIVTLLLPLAWHYALAAAGPFLATQFGLTLMEKILPYAAFLPLVALIHFGLKRLVNLGMSRLWCLAVFLPVINLWLGYRCFACPPGYAYHKKLDGSGIALAIVYWIVMSAVVLILAACVAMLCGAIDSPVLLKQLRRLI